MQEIDGIKVWGDPVDDGAFRQIVTCARDAADVALMADHHKGYAVPIGGVVAYVDKVSPSGVGYDIGCIASGTPVVTDDGFHLPIESVLPDHAVIGWDGETVRRILPNLGAIDRGVKPVRKMRLTNGRALTCTPDHLIRTADGWKPAADLKPGDKVACLPFLGLPYEAPVSHDLPPVLLSSFAAPLLRLLGVVCGDGHLSRDGKRISIRATTEADAEAISRDFARLGYSARIVGRMGPDGRLTELRVHVNATAPHRLLAELGAPLGRKEWGCDPMPYLLRSPRWMRAQFLSGFFSGACRTPRFDGIGKANPEIKPSGGNPDTLRFVARLLTSLGYAASVAPVGREREGRRDWLLQVHGGVSQQVRLCEEVGFCYASLKRLAASEVASVFWQSVGTSGREVLTNITGKLDVSCGFACPAIDGDRVFVRREPGKTVTPDVSGEIVWCPIDRITEQGETRVFDIVTGDPAHCFVASGVVVHNCGNKAVRLDIPAREVRTKIKKLMDEIYSKLSFGMGRNNNEEVDHELFDDETWKLPAMRTLKQTARNQLGTIGGGNHYVDLFVDEADRVWVGVHFGSRGLGHKTATHFLEMGQAKPGMDAEPLVLDVRSSLGSEYLQCMELAGKYAYAGRDWVCGKVARILGGKIVEEIHNHHNYAWKETHHGQEMYVVRKGATPAFPGQKGFVGGSMGDISVILEGVDSEEARKSLYSTVHGAGRVMSRTAARGKMKGGKVIAPGAVTHRMMEAWVVRDKGVELRGGGTDESPHCYKRIEEVLAHHAGTVRLLHTLTPIGVAMAGENEIDPYKD
ncbi:MAG: RtcB family protein [Capsulimonadales bacterium]|nr:RtcB family protein [Capsulimonadales bacterium]